MNWCLRLHDWWAISGQWLYDWQTLIGAGLALLAAGSIYRVTRQSIAQSAEFNRVQVERAHNAARVVMPLALSAISEICQQVADAVAQELEAAVPFAELLEVVDPPDNVDQLARFQRVGLSGEALSAMQRFVETLTTHENVRHTAELISSLQLLLSRFHTFDLRQVPVEDGLHGLLIDAAKVQMLVGAMFNYARFVDDQPFGLVGTMNFEMVWNRIRTAARGLIFLRPDIDRIEQPVSERIRRYTDQGISPWNEIFEH